MLDRRRIEDAFFQFAVLEVVQWYPGEFDTSKLQLHHNATSTIYNVTAIYHGLFMKKWAGTVV